MAKKNITVQVQPEMAERIKDLAVTEGVSQGALIERALDAYLGNNGANEVLELLRALPETFMEAMDAYKARKAGPSVYISTPEPEKVPDWVRNDPNVRVSDSREPLTLDELKAAGLVSAGPPKRIEGQVPCVCKHSGCRFGDGKFLGTRKGQDLCPDCFENGHRGEPRDCKSCFDDMGPA